jgi:hypothetical protein
MARTIGKNTVLPDIPYSPSLPSLPQVSLVNDTLPARNAMGQGLTQAGPRPSAPIVNMPAFVIPPTTSFDMATMVAGGGHGQGVVPNMPRPAPAITSMPKLDLSALASSQEADFDISAYGIMGQRLTPEAQYSRPSHTAEIYGDQNFGPDVSHMNRMKAETIMPKINAHQPTQTFGASPAFEVDTTSIRPSNPRAMFSGAPKLNVPASQTRMPIRERPIIPASTQPMLNHNQVVRSISPPKKIRMEAQHIAPPVRNADLGGFGAESSNGFGTGIGRAFGANAALYTPF